MGSLWMFGLFLCLFGAYVALIDAPARARERRTAQAIARFVLGAVLVVAGVYLLRRP